MLYALSWWCYMPLCVLIICGAACHCVPYSLWYCMPLCALQFVTCMPLCTLQFVSCMLCAHGHLYGRQQQGRHRSPYSNVSLLAIIVPCASLTTNSLTTSCRYTHTSRLNILSLTLHALVAIFALKIYIDRSVSSSNTTTSVRGVMPTSNFADSPSFDTHRAASRASFTTQIPLVTSGGSFTTTARAASLITSAPASSRCPPPTLPPPPQHPCPTSLHS